MLASAFIASLMEQFYELPQAASFGWRPGMAEQLSLEQFQRGD